jgi:hypothetical protein
MKREGQLKITLSVVTGREIHVKSCIPYWNLYTEDTIYKKICHTVFINVAKILKG